MIAIHNVKKVQVIKKELLSSNTNLYELMITNDEGDKVIIELFSNDINNLKIIDNEEIKDKRI